MIEVNTKLKFEDKVQNPKRSHFEIIFSTIVKINEEINILVLLPFSNKFRSIGEKIRKAIDLAVLQSKNKRIKFVYFNTGEDFYYNDLELVIEKLNPRLLVGPLLRENLIKINKLIERLNIEFLKQKFTNQAQLKASKYLIDLNSRKMSLNNLSLKLTEKEVNTIIYLSKSEKPVSVDELQEKVWSYHSDIETHTVETHIYRLRKKISKTFNDNNFITSERNGYQIK